MHSWRIRGGAAGRCDTGNAETEAAKSDALRAADV